jgi:Ala-tRNA(Pro) deacylase
MSDNEAKLYADLKSLGIEYTVLEHPAVFTVEESSAIERDMPGAHTKNLFLKDAGGVFWLVTVPAEARVDLKALPAAMGSKRVSFGKAEDMERLIGVTPGSVTPLAAINAVPGSINVIIDAGLANADQVNCHPLRNTATLGLASVKLIDALRHWGHDPKCLEIPSIHSAN